ncbi:MAG: LysR family transcriptional regulator [Rhodospirillaceae bacterium]
MNLKQIETFVWVATLGSFRKAAEKLNSSQPAISSRIDALETLLGVKLFERHAGRFTLSAKGMELLPYAQKLFLMSVMFKERACEANTLSGVLRLGVSETIVHTWLSEFLKRVHDQYPMVTIELTVDVTSTMRDELVARSLDLSFLMGPISMYSIENAFLCDYELAWICRSDFDLPEGDIPLADLLSKPILTYARNTRPFAEIHALTKKEGIAIPRLFPSTSLSACQRMTEDGLGIGTLPMALIKDALAQGSLRKLETSWSPSSLVFTASYPREPVNPIAEHMAALAVEVAASHS